MPTDPQGRRPRFSRTVVRGVVVLVIMMALMGMMQSLRQSHFLATGRIAHLRPDTAQKIRELEARITRNTADFLEKAGTTDDPESLIWPEWIKEIHILSEKESEIYHKPSRKILFAPRPLTTAPATQGMESLRSMFSLRLPSLEASANDTTFGEPIGFIQDNIAGENILTAWRILPVKAEDIYTTTVAGVFDLDAMLKKIIRPELLGEGKLTLVHMEEVGDPTIEQVKALWSETLNPLFPFWSVRPSRDFVIRQQADGMRQTILYMAINLFVLLTLLIAIFATNRAVQRELNLSRLKSNFVADVSHELKTPLALIRMFGETLMQGRVRTPEKAQEYYEIITRESTRLTHMINNILDFSRIDAGRKDFRRDPVDVGQVALHTYEAYRHDLDRQGFEHKCIIEEHLPTIEGDSDAIGQVILNLISNAVKYSDDEKSMIIEVSPETRRDHHGVTVAVHDRGIGIRPEDRAHLFDGFFRASQEQVRKKRGAGLGLSLCKQIIDAHCGVIEVESRLVKGSTFRVFLPAGDHATNRKDG